MRILSLPPLTARLARDLDELPPQMVEVQIVYDPTACARAHRLLLEQKLRNVDVLAFVCGARAAASIAAYAAAARDGIRDEKEINGMRLDFTVMRGAPSLDGIAVLYDPKLPDNEIRALFGIDRIGK